jgi:beta-phosphoglucomutase-like phosphatase (HAD superfamily)
VTGIHQEQIMSRTTTLPRKAHAVILDMDGLMFDTEALYRDAVIAAAADGGHDISTAFYLSTIGMSMEATRTAFRERCGQDFDFDLFWTQRRNFARSPNCSCA